MKKFLRTAALLFVSISFVSTSALISCRKGEGGSSTSSPSSGESSASKSGEPRTYSGKFYTLDYTPETPEPKSVPSKLDTSFQNAGGGAQEKRRARTLKDYKTKYNTERKSYSDFNYSDDPDKVSPEGTEGELTVLDWGPKGSIVAENDYPTFYVVFSEPVRALSALEDTKDTSDVLEISPKLKGTFHWLGTDQISFEAEESAEPSKAYTLRVNKDLRSVKGTAISGETEFTTTADPIKIERIRPGSTIEKNCTYSSGSGLPESLARNLVVGMNMKMDAETFKSVVSVYDSREKGSPFSYTAEPVLQNKYGARFDAAKGTSDTFAVEIDAGAKIMRGRVIVVAAKGSADSGESETRKSFNTLKPFEVSDVGDQVSRSTSEMMNPLSISFNQTPDKNGAERFIKVYDSDGKAVPVGKDNVKVLNREIILYNLGIKGYGTEYTLEILPGLKDIYGQTLGMGGSSSVHKFRIPDAKSYFNIADRGARMLEWQFPHKIAFDYQNIRPTSGYYLNSITDPLVSSWISSRDSQNGVYTQFAQVPENTKMIDTLDLDPYLNDGGYGFVEFVSKIDSFYYYKDWETGSLKKEDTSEARRLTVQVTDLGVTARVGINRAVVLVRSLSTNKPVEGADVSVCLNDTNDDDGVFGEILESGKTDSDGFAVIEISDEAMAKIEEDRNRAVSIFVESGKDRAVFVPDSHGYNWNSIRDARDETPRVFMFTDRGLYKPGETVSFRGIDKTQRIGNLDSYSGLYTITVESTAWNNDTVYARIEGEASGSGGFFGSFTLPDDLEPGNYRIRYSREGDNSYYGNGSAYFLVAYFEPVKFQTEINIPGMTYYSGDSINAKIKSTYLAGGALGNASYESTWLRNPVSFRPDTAFASGYTFGPKDLYDAASEVEQNAGTLNADGGAVATVQTGRTKIETPYVYYLDAAVTDVSNQRISASSAVTVHSSRFYAGVKMNANGFPKKGSKIEFPFVIVDPDGEAVSSEFISGDMTVDFSRVTWELTNMNGLDDDIYSRYERVTTSVKTEKVPSSSIADGKGKISFTPEKSGDYVMTLTGRDVFGNPVKTEYSFFVTGSDYYWHGNDSNELNLTADKNLYNPGDKAQVLLSSPLEAGDYLITVEREGIITQEVRHFDSSCSVIEVPIARCFVPVVYVSVASYSTRTKQPTHQYGEKDTDKPKGYYGVTELFVNPYVRAFSVSVESDKKVYRPGDEATITLKATRGGKPVENAELTLMAVDRAVLDLINYHVPNPIEYFYSRSHFGNHVHGGDSRDLLMDPVTYAIKNLQGGDADGEKDDGDERKNFKSTALFEPVVFTGKDGVAKVTFKLPDNLTTFRITAVGVSGELFALQESEIGVRNPINVQSVQPRRMRARDTAECGVLLTNMDSVPQKVKVSLSIRKPEGDYDEDFESGRITVPGEAFIDGAAEQTLTVPSGASYTALFDVAAVKAGNVELVYTVKSDILNEKLVSPILIEKTFVYDTVSLSGSTDDSQDAADKQFIQIPSWAEDGEGEVSVTLDATQLGLLSSAVDYVFGYPYGCIEQKTSAVIPLVIFDKYIDVFGLNSKVRDVRKLVLSHFKFLQKHQHISTDGGFGYWPDSERSSFFVSLKVAQLCAYAMERGYKSSELSLNLDALLSYIEGKMGEQYNKSQEAYAYYVLSKCERYNDAAVDRVYGRVKGKDFDSMAYCALYYAEQNGEANKAKAQAIADELRKYMQVSSRSVSILPTNSREYWAYFDSDTENLALSLQLLSQLDPDDKMVDRLVFTLLQSQSKGYWHSTYETATVLESICAYIKARNLDAVNFTAQAELMGVKLADGKFEGAGAKPVTKAYRFDSEELGGLERGKNLSLEFSKSGTGRLYYTAQMKYALPDELQNSRDEGIRLNYQIFNAATGKIVEPKKGTKLIELDSGVTYKARVIVSTSKDRLYMALRAPIPSGGEILDANFVTSGHDAGATLGSSGEPLWKHRVSNMVLYDNEAHFFWDDFEKGSCAVEFKFRTARRGAYPVPPAQAELMYEPEVFGRSDGYLFVIK